MRDTAIDRILQPSLSFVRDRDRGLAAVGDREVSEKLGSVACPEDLVDGREVRGAEFVAEVRGKDAAIDTLSSKKLASSTRRRRRRS